MMIAIVLSEKLQLLFVISIVVESEIYHAVSLSRKDLLNCGKYGQ
jgi:hypothetical protein